MKKILRHRSVLILLAPLLVLAALWFTDPDGGASTGIWLLRVATAIIAVSAAHWVRKATFDYPEADLRTLFGKARESATGAGLALVAVAIFYSAVIGLFGGVARAQDVATYIPANAQTHLATLAAEQRAHWPDHPRPAVLAALVEHESCISLKHSRCWNPTSKLKTSREEGAGLGQITRAYRQDGSLRFDALAEMRGRHPALSDWSWENVYRRPDLQLRALILMNRDNFQALHRTAGQGADLLAFTDAAYNGGLGGVQAERRACAAAKGCDPRRWFGHVEHRCLKSRAALYGNRSVCDINRHHVHDVLVTRTPKYERRVSA